MKVSAFLFACTYVLGLFLSTRAFPCLRQTGQNDFETIECDTYCLIAYYKNTAIPSFLNIDKLCSAIGCAELNGDGSLNVEATGVQSDGFPADGTVVIYQCTDDIRNDEPGSFEYGPSSGEPCNKYTDYQGEQLCKNLPSEYIVAEVEVEGNWWEVYMYELIGGAAGLLVLLGVGMYCYLKRFPSEDSWDLYDYDDDELDGEQGKMSL